MKFCTRRSLVLGGVVLGSVSALVAAAKFRCSLIVPRRQSSNSTATLLADLHPAPGAAKLLGSAYLDYTGEPAMESLRRIEHNEHIKRGLSLRCTYEIRSALERSYRSDFSAGRTFRIDGWILSQTELDLSVLVLLCTRNAPRPITLNAGSKQWQS